jgi:hypothetical protein
MRCLIWQKGLTEGFIEGICRIVLDGACRRNLPLKRGMYLAVK